MSRNYLSVLTVTFLSLWVSAANATFTFTNVTYTSTSVTFTIDGDMVGYTAPNSRDYAFSLRYGGDIFNLPAPFPGYTPNTWSRPVFDNETLDNDGATIDLDPDLYSWSYYATSLSDASVSSATVTLSFPEPYLNVAANSPTITFVWGVGATGSGGVPLYTVLSTVVPTPEAPTTYSVGGSVSGLTGTGLSLQNNGGDTLAVAAAATTFTFATELPDLATYAVTVSTQPTGQTCSVTGGDNSLGGGAIAGANVTSVVVTCVDNVMPTYSVGGTVSGLTGTGLALQNNASDTLAITADGPFTFSTELLDAVVYAVTVSAQPTGQTCSVTNGSGTIAAADVTNVAVTCVDDVVVPPMEAAPIPTASQWALILLSMLIILMAFANRRRLF